MNMVYKTFNPFDYETGEGRRCGPVGSRAALCRCSSIRNIFRIWARSGPRRNGSGFSARCWRSSPRSTRTPRNGMRPSSGRSCSLEVGNPDAQDQRSLAKNETLEESKGIYAPGEEPTADEPAAPAAAPDRRQRRAAWVAGRRWAAERRRRRNDGMMGGGGATAAPESIFYVKADSDKYKVLPFAVTVLIDQDRVQDFLVELENSPMSIQVKDFELVRPSTRVTKPEKGDAERRR